jgi:protein-disulfide isomerase
VVGIVTPGRLAVPVGAADHVRGPEQAPITLVEYGHYQSSDCASLQPDLDDLLRHRKPQVRLVYRHFPAPPSDTHPYMFVAAEIAEAAAVRHRFWEMHDWMFEHQHDMGWASLRRAELILDMPPEAVDVEISRQMYRDRIMRDVDSGRRSGVWRAPTLFVDDVRVDAPSLPDLLPALDRALSVAGRGR